MLLVSVSKNRRSTEFPVGIRPHFDTQQLVKHHRITLREASNSAVVEFRIAKLQMVRAEERMQQKDFAGAAQLFDSALQSVGKAFSFGLPPKLKSEALRANNEAIERKAECERLAD